MSLSHYLTNGKHETPLQTKIGSSIYRKSRSVGAIMDLNSVAVTINFREMKRLRRLLSQYAFRIEHPYRVTSLKIGQWVHWIILD